MRAKRIWEDRGTLVAELRTRGQSGMNNALSISSVTKSGKRRAFIKARSGRGRKQRLWVQVLGSDSVDEFERLRKFGIKFSMNTLLLLAKDLVAKSEKKHTTKKCIWAQIIGLFKIK